MKNAQKLNDNERQPVECWTRVMGYFRPISNFNKGKQSEFRERVYFKVFTINKEQKKFDMYHKI